MESGRFKIDTEKLFSKVKGKGILMESWVVIIALLSNFTGSENINLNLPVSKND